ncbi:transcriptional regulator [Erwiniaceae bacterium CAU 1747]
MKYSINNYVEFDACDGILSLMSDENVSVQLSKPGCRLLNELVTHSGTTLTRDELLQNVWENHGLTPSSNNLSNHISFLRKILSQLGMEDNIIITSPREGFRLEADVQRICDSRCNQDEKEQDDGDVEENPVAHAITKEKTTNKLIQRLCYFIKREVINRHFIALAAILLSLIFLKDEFSNVSLFNEKNAISSVGLCSIVDLESGKEIIDKEKINLVKKIINEKNINCVNKRSRIYMKKTQLTKGSEHHQQAIFIVQCLSEPVEKESRCESYLSLKLQKP